MTCICLCSCLLFSPHDPTLVCASLIHSGADETLFPHYQCSYGTATARPPRGDGFLNRKTKTTKQNIKKKKDNFLIFENLNAKPPNSHKTKTGTKNQIGNLKKEKGKEILKILQ